MDKSSSQFVGNIPENYDRGLGPHIFHYFADDLARRAAAAKPAEVLELAAGTGIVTRKLKDSLNPDVRLVATDLNPPMLIVAGSKFAADETVEFQQADAMALPFGDDEFDLIVCQFGVMFFPDIQASFREAMRVLRPGGRYLFNVWGSMSENPYSQIAQDVGAKFFPDDPPGFYKVPFGYADQAVVLADMAAGGLQDIQCETLSLDQTVADWALFAHGLVFGNPLIDEIHNRGGVDPEAVEQAIRDALRGRFGDEPSSMPLLATVYSGSAA